MSNRDFKIELINAYRKLLDTGRVPKTEKDTDKGVNHTIEEAFRAWVERQIAVLLGEKAPLGEMQFTEEEVRVLKALVSRINDRGSAPAAQSAHASSSPTEATSPRTPQSTGITLTEADRARLAHAKPLIERTPKVQRQANESAAIARLEQMDREGPEF
jgi:hypothetical protein